MYKIEPFGDQGLRVQFGESISPEANQQVRNFSEMLTRSKIRGVIEWIPAYITVTIIYNPYIISFAALQEKITELLNSLTCYELPKGRTIMIPCCYGNKYGPDLDYVANYNNLSTDEVISIHSNPKYLLYMMGFTPGFPYLGGMDKRIATPRQTEPRLKIAAGSIGIAGEQTGIYPLESPGGWQIIGRTPVKLFNPNLEQPFILEPGDYLKFVPINEREFVQIEKDIEKGLD